MFFNLYKSEMIRIKYTVMMCILIPLVGQALNAIFIRETYGSSEHHALFSLFIVLIDIAMSVFYVLIPILYVWPYMKHKEYFLLYPLSSLKKYLLIIAVCFTLVIGFTIISMIPVVIIDTKIVWHFVKYLLDNPPYVTILLLIITMISITFFLINLATFKWLIFVFVIGGSLVSSLGSTIWQGFFVHNFSSFNLYMLLNHSHMITNMEIFWIISSLVSIVIFGCVGYIRMAELQASSNRYVLQYYIILAICLFFQPIISDTIYRFFVGL